MSFFSYPLWNIPLRSHTELLIAPLHPTTQSPFSSGTTPSRFHTDLPQPVTCSVPSSHYSQFSHRHPFSNDSPSPTPRYDDWLSLLYYTVVIHINIYILCIDVHPKSNGIDRHFPPPNPLLAEYCSSLLRFLFRIGRKRISVDIARQHSTSCPKMEQLYA